MKMMKINDRLAQLLRVETRCSPGVLEFLFGWYSKTVYQAAFFILKDSALAEDVTQETFLVAYTKLDRLQHPERIEAWLIQVAMHKAYDLAEEHRRLVLVPEPAAPERMEGNLILNLVIDRETTREMKRAISNLPVPYQEVLYFKYYKEFTARQIAEALEIPEGTVKSRLIKAKLLIARELGVTRERRDRTC